ncbi:MAG TPA: hypothetical protein PKI11_00715 [Candidatus Hydrogenedentes bacterium]|nr:hypothetical protein [Candidatus Hydrogenedentota bacterium]HNT86556.1 hypothetical protein [Candidatus Hydrogenedentota bacterium]
MLDYQTRSFLERNLVAAMELADQSDILELKPFAGDPVRKYIARFHARGLVRDPVTGEIGEAPFCDVGIWFPDDYLQRCTPFEVLTWLCPPHAWHPQIRAPFICPGRLGEGTQLVDILYQCYDIWTYQKVNWGDALNHEAAAWGRRCLDRLPVDKRPLKRRRVAVNVRAAEAS